MRASRVGAGVLALPHVAQVGDGAHGVGAHDAVGGQTGVALELARGMLGEGAEDAVDRPAREAERVERLLQHGDVVPVEVRQAQVEHPVAEGEARVDERGPRPVADHPVLGEAVPSLELAYRLRGRAEEHAVDAGAPKVVAQGEQAALDVFDSGAPVTGPHGSHLE